MIRYIWAVLILLGVSCGISYAGDDAAKALLAKAEQVSNLQVKDAQAFQVKISFRALHLNAGDVDGHYALFWNSDERWRVESHLGNFRETDVRVPKKLWRSSNEIFTPGPIGNLKSLLTRFQKPGSNVGELGHFGKLHTEKIGTVEAQCFTAKDKFENYRLCFDPEAGVLLRAEVGSFGTSVYEYSDYKPFGAKLVPRRMKFGRSGTTLVEATVESIEVWEPTEAAWQQPEGARERATCTFEEMKPPKAVYQPDPVFPDGVPHQGRHLVGLHLVLSAEGKIAGLEVQTSGGPEFDAEALRAIRQWKFTPAICNGEPAEVEISIEVRFWL